jgi:hypothetical protein
LKLKAPVEKQIGVEAYPDGTVKYAYRTEKSVDTVPASAETLATAREQGLTLGAEVAEKRTGHARTFATNRAGVYISEIVSGDPPILSR